MKLLCTQCEAMGFRRITYALDRPDVLAKYTVKLTGDKTNLPVLLSNGNLIESGDVEGGKHYAIWEDPFPKPSYLFAIVAGELVGVHGTHKTPSGREVQLYVYSDKKSADKLDFSLFSLKKSMEWDEAIFGLEYDLDIYNIVATSDFNMGAMENKSLNVFNTAYVLADPATATDYDHQLVLGVVGHEYFHNWTGNRVTVRDWFQLTLKEGLTVLRDQLFTADHTSEAIKRIEDVKTLRARQFAEDAGPMAHQIRPNSYISMDNFYTSTVYNKGAEVIRMFIHLLSFSGFQEAMNTYISRHDGHAVTCDDFRFAMRDTYLELEAKKRGVKVSDLVIDGEDVYDVDQMENWYNQAGTPSVFIEQAFDASSGEYNLKIKQVLPKTPADVEGVDKKPMLIPLKTAFFDAKTGEKLAMKLKKTTTCTASGEASPETVELPIIDGSTLLLLNTFEKEYTFTGLSEKPVLSTLRGFSAPVKLEIKGQTDEDLVFLMEKDDDSFNRWESGARYSSKLIHEIATKPLDQIASTELPESFLKAFKGIISSASEEGKDLSLIAVSLDLPSLQTLMTEIESEIDIDALAAARSVVVNGLSKYIKQEVIDTLNKLRPVSDISKSEKYEFTSEEVGKRALINVLISYVGILAKDDASLAVLLKQHYDQSACMSHRVGPLNALVNIKGPERDAVLEHFYAQAKSTTPFVGDDLTPAEVISSSAALLLDKWFAVQARGDYEGILEDIEALTRSPDFNLTNPNRVRSVLATFGMMNTKWFHEQSGRGYELMANLVIQVDAKNPQIGARLLNPFSVWKKMAGPRKELMRQQLEKIRATENLSPDSFEIVSKYLA